MYFIISLSRIANTGEIDDIKIHDDIWQNIWKYNVDIMKLFTREQRMHACGIVYRLYDDLFEDSEVDKYSNPAKKCVDSGLIDSAEMKTT